MSERLKEVIGRDAIRRRIGEMGHEISEIYRDTGLLAVCVLKGGFIFFADLVRALDFSPEVDFVRLASYGRGTTTCGCVSFTKDVECELGGRHVLLVDDIVDTGLSLKFLHDELSKRGPASVRTCVLIDKVERRETAVTADYAGFTVQSGFMVGYGMDYGEKYRNLDGLYTLELPAEE